MKAGLRRTHGARQQEVRLSPRRGAVVRTSNGPVRTSCIGPMCEIAPRGTLKVMSLNLGLGVALACAFLTQLGFLCKHRGANHACAVNFQKPFASARSLFTTRWFLIGLGIGFAGWGLHVVALALAPLITVQAVLSTGVVMLAVLGNRRLRLPRPAPPVGRRRR